jgi:hypothetical protein
LEPDHPTDPKYAEYFVDIIKSFDGLIETTVFSLGNHDGRESGSDETKRQLEDYFGIADWRTTKQEGNFFIICINSQIRTGI